MPIYKKSTYHERSFVKPTAVTQKMEKVYAEHLIMPSMEELLGDY